MPSNKGLEWTFDTATTVYDKMRPGYVDALYREILDYIPINASCKAVEVGIGTGQATTPILATGCELTAVEYGESLAEKCRIKFKDYPTFSVITGKFEDAALEEDSYDLVFSATAFHWIPEEEGYQKVYAILKHGGAFARFANHPYPGKDNPPLREEIDGLYAIYHHSDKKKTLKEYSEEQAQELAAIASKYGFADVRHAMFYRTRTFTAKEYVALLATYSDNIALDEPVRMEFFSKIEEAINKHGGEINIHDTIDLQLARKV